MAQIMPIVLRGLHAARESNDVYTFDVQYPSGCSVSIDFDKNYPPPQPLTVVVSGNFEPYYGTTRWPNVFLSVHRCDGPLAVVFLPKHISDPSFVRAIRVPRFWSLCLAVPKKREPRYGLIFLLLGAAIIALRYLLS